MPTCARCHKPLSDEDSIQRGFGPECWGQVQADRESRQEHLGGELGPFGDEVILSLTAQGDALTNIVHRKIIHSPTGFGWGYAGSGPADLALNILLYFVNEHQAVHLYQEFKRAFLVGIPEAGGRIPRVKIQEWVDQFLGALPLEERLA
jgi:hypothetical protein